MGFAMSTTSYTRPANTTQYAANDALSDSASDPSALTFAGCAAETGGSGLIRRVSFIDSANQGTLPTFELYLFDGSSAPTATNDNAEFGLTDANALNLIGVLAFSSVLDADVTAGADGNAYKEVEAEIPFVCGAATNLYGLVKVTNTYTPVSEETWTFRLHIER